MKTVASFADEFKMTVTVVLALFARAGIQKSKPDEFLTMREEDVLLAFLRNTAVRKRNPSKQQSRLTVVELDFLKLHNVPMSKVFDATGMSTPQYKLAMKELGLQVAFGVTPCEKKGHRLRVRSGHCVQCDTKNLAFLRRFDADGEVYLAQSRATNFIKIGSSIDPSVRLQNLNRCGYGGATDWEIIESHRTVTAARVECTTQQNLETHRIRNVYYYDGRELECYELFNCDVKTAQNALSEALSRIGRIR